ncbi:MAG: type I-G CRISPR-associated protein Cas8g1/Csx17 [Halothiobacillaceae bacterium]
MAEIVFNGVSPRSLGDLLKGYGIMAILGEDCPAALFWWDDAFHLAMKRPCDEGRDEKAAKKQITELARERLFDWAKVVAGFKPRRGEKCGQSLPCPYHGNAGAKKGKDRCQESSLLLRTSRFYDELDPKAAGLARAVAVPVTERRSVSAGKKWRDETEPIPLFPAHGQEGSGDYFSQIEKAVELAKKAPNDISWSLFGDGPRPLREVLDSGYLFFPEPMKRYATGVTKWEREKDAPRSPWDFLLAVRGALLLRGSLRRLRWGRRAYPAFPFVFEGQTVALSGGTFFENVEIHLPTWRNDRPRTLAEFEMQMRQFQARLSGRGFAATAAEFRAAVVGRGVGAAFDTFHRFVLEGRRPGQRQPMRQGIPRGSTRVGGKCDVAGRLRLMLAPLAETAWFDQFTTDRLRAERARAEEAIHRAVDEPGLDAYREILEALWELNRAIILPGALRREFEDRKQTPRPLPPLPARLWEEALRDGLEKAPAYRLGRAIGSILGVKPQKERPGIGPILEHMLPVQYSWDGRRWVVPDPPPSRPLRWSGADPLGDFATLLWSRWLDSSELDQLPFEGARHASLEDVVSLLRGEVDIREVHRLAGLFALLGWQSQEALVGGGTFREPTAVSPAYAALRLWLELGIRPGPDARPPRDGEVVRLLAIGEPAQLEYAAALALRRLRVDGLPWDEDPRPTGKAVAHFEAKIPSHEAARLAVSVIVPIREEETLALSRRLWVPMDEKEVMAL